MTQLPKTLSEVWTNDDWLAGHCACEDIGQSKYEQKTKPQAVQETPQSVIAELPPTTMAELKQAALRVARGKMGYDEFLAKNPQFHQKFLLSMAKEAPPPQRQDISVNISWLTQERLSYKDREPLEVVQEEPRALPSVPTPWKEPAADGLAQTMRDAKK